MKKLDEKIAFVKQRGTWDGVDVDKYMDEVRGREPEKPMHQEGLKVASVELADMLLAKQKDYAISAKADYWNGAHDGVIAGAKWDRSQMMKEAVEGYVNYYEDSGGILIAEAQVGCPYHNGDKVRIIIVKEDL